MHASTSNAACDVTRSLTGMLLWYGVPVLAIFAAGQLLADGRLIGNIGGLGAPALWCSSESVLGRYR